MKIVVLVIVALVAAFFIVAMLIPKHHIASVSRIVRGTPNDVYAIVRDVANAPQWREVQKVELLDATHFKEHAKHGVVTYEIVDDKPADTFATRIVDKDLGYSGSWTYRFAPENGGTRVTITENGEVSNLLFRFLSRFVFGYTGSMQKTLAALATKCDTAPRPSAVPTPAR